MSDTNTSTLNGYDGAMDSSVRSTLIFPRNSRVEHNAWTRRRLQEKQRGLEANFFLAGRIKSLLGRRIVGKGIVPYPITSDTKWNVIARNFFRSWASNPAVYSIDNSRTMWTDQRMVAEAGGGDGEYFEAFVTRDGALTMQPLDPFEIETPYNKFLEYEDGVRFDAYLKPEAFAVRELPSPLMPYIFEWREVPAENMIHVFHRRRAKQGRGLPPAYAVLNDGIDAMDTLALEKSTAKLHAALGITRVVKAVDKGKGISGNLEKSLGSDGKGTKLEEKFWQGAGMLELNEGESLDLLTSERPAEPVIAGVKFYCSLFALGNDLPFSVVFSFADLGGTPTRAEMEDAQNVYDLRQEQIVWQHSRPIYIRRMALAQLNGEIPKCKDPYWWAADWHGPAKSTVDYGRTADADISLVRNMMMSTPRYQEERNRDAFDEADKQIAFIKYVQDQSAANGVAFERVIEPTPGAVTKNSITTHAAD